jgi:hypothetical protein
VSMIKTIRACAMLLALVACVRTRSIVDQDVEVPTQLLGRSDVDIAQLTPEQMAAILAQVAKDSVRLEKTGFLHRAATIDDAYFVTPEEIAAMQPRTIADIFRHVPVLIEAPNPVSSRRGNQGCFINYINGIVRRARVPSELDTFIHPRDVVAAEVYPPGQLPPAPFNRSSNASSCTTVALWTRT